jgi:UTP-glucose-1-phosphate uridylyltransferase/ubiquinone/menaquinone biosynthesis C-methylase UbiE
VFANIAGSPAQLSLSHEVLGEYVTELLGTVGQRLADLPPGAVVCDVGGGTGALSIAMGALRPDLRLVCFDRSEVVSLAQTQNRRTPNVTFVAGDFFSDPIPGADLYILSRVLHDWDDGHATQLLHNLARSFSSSSRLLVVDRVKTPGNRLGLLSLHMMFLQNACERAVDEWKELYSSAPFNLESIEPIPGGYSLMSLTAAHESLRPLVPRRLIRKAVIPIAGNGSRMMPWSSLVPKCMLPCNVVDADSKEEIVAPALKLLLDDVLRLPQIDSIFLVISPSSRPLLQSFLQEFYSDRSTEISLIEQPCANGLGDAVLQTEAAIGQEPFLIVLGDHLYSQGALASVLQSFEKVAETHPSNSFALAGACTCSEGEIAHTGLLCLDYSLPRSDAFVKANACSVSALVEKPLDGAINFIGPTGNF